MELDFKDNNDQEKPEGIFTLLVNIPDHPSQKLGVLDKISAGIDPRNDLIIVGPLIKHKHYLFKKNKTHLTLEYLGVDGESTLNGVALENGKQYVLENGDELKSGKITISVGFEESGSIYLNQGNGNESLNSDFDSSDSASSTNDFEDNNVQQSDNSEVEQAPTEEKKKKPLSGKLKIIKPKIKIAEQINPALKSYQKGLKLIPYKIWGFIFDVCFTYFVLAFVLPIAGLESLAKEYLFPVSQYISQVDFINSLNSEFNVLSLIEYYICFHIIMILSSILLATTPGAFFIGLHQKREKANFVEIHFRAYIYALINVFLLPFIFFDLPLINGRTIKEIVTFSERDVKRSIIASTIRRAVSPFAILVFLMAPLFLPFPFNINVAEFKTKINKQKFPQSHLLISHSPALGVKVKTEIPTQFLILPYFDSQKIGLVLHDLKNKKMLIMTEEKRIEIDELLFHLRFSNPIASLSTPDFEISPIELKKRSIEHLKSTPLDAIEQLLSYGPFIANGILFKHDLLSSFTRSDNFLYNSFNANNPLLLINSAKTDKVLLFNPKQAIWFNLIYPKNSNLLNIFCSLFLDPTVTAPDVRSKNMELSVYEALEAFEKASYQTLLSYYLQEAKKIVANEDAYLKDILIKNIEQTKKALRLSKRNKGLPQKVENYFDEISKTIQDQAGQ